jgi:hypothetical protein
MDETTALLTSTNDQHDDDDIFGMFRLVFEAERCTRRLVYWIEASKFGTTVLRQRLIPNPSSKKDDKVIATFTGAASFNQLRLAICNANLTRLLTGVRWEIYRDQACSELYAMGRFDYMDLLGNIERDELETLSRSGQTNVPMRASDIDFDGLLLTHTCPKCSQIYGKEHLFFDPNFQSCRACGYNKWVPRQGKPEPRSSPSNDVARPNARAEALIIMSRIASHRDDTLSAETEVEQPSITKLLEVNATPVFIWLFKNVLYGNPFYDHGFVAHDSFAAQHVQSVIACYMRSMFHTLKVPMLHQLFTEFALAVYDKRLARASLEPTTLSTPECPPELRLEFRLRSIREERTSFIRNMETIRRLDTWLNTAPPQRPTAQEGQTDLEFRTAVSEALSSFLDYLEMTLFAVAEQIKNSQPMKEIVQ